MCDVPRRCMVSGDGVHGHLRRSRQPAAAVRGRVCGSDSGGGAVPLFVPPVAAAACGGRWVSNGAMGMRAGPWVMGNGFGRPGRSTRVAGRGVRGADGHRERRRRAASAHAARPDVAAARRVCL